MTRGLGFCTALLALATVGAACGPNLTAVPPGPATGPTTLAPLLLPRLEGVWGGSVTFTGVAGGTGPATGAGGLACVGAAYIATVGEVTTNTLAIKQTGTTLTAKLSSASNGLSCEYTGQVGANGAIVLNADSCSSATSLLIRCPTTGEVLTLEYKGSTITAVIDAPVAVTAITGTVAHTYNVESQSGLVTNHSFSALTKF